MADTPQEVKFLTIKQVRALFASKPTLDCIRNWMKFGVHNRMVKNGQGDRIKLQHIREGHVMMTTIQWVVEFKNACLGNVKRPLK